MKKITGFNIDDSNIGAATVTRTLRISGDAGSRFIMFISNDTSNNLNFYNFDTQAFSAGERKLEDEIPEGGVYDVDIVFPAAGSGGTQDDKFNFLLIANAFYGVELDEGLSDSSKVFYKKTIEQKGNATVTFAVASSGSAFQTMPSSVTVVDTPSSSINTTKVVDWTVSAVDSASGGAIKITRQPLETDFKFTTVQVSVGAGSTDDKIYLTSVDKLCSGSVSGSPTITEINTVSKYVKVSVAQTWADTKNITFTGNGNRMAFDALGLKFSIPNDVGFVATLVPFTGTLNGAISNSNALVMDSVFGVRADGTVTFTGIGIDNSSDNFVTSINYSTKTLEVTTNQTLEDNTIITFKGCARQCTLQTSIVVTKMPAENVTLTLDLDSILTSSTT